MWIACQAAEAEVKLRAEIRAELEKEMDSTIEEGKALLKDAAKELAAREEKVKEGESQLARERETRQAENARLEALKAEVSEVGLRKGP